MILILPNIYIKYMAWNLALRRILILSLCLLILLIVLNLLLNR